MPRGSGGGSRSRSGGFRSSGSSGPSSRSPAPSAPNEVVVRYPNGVPTVVRPSDYEAGVFEHEFSSDSNLKDLHPKCKRWLESTLLNSNEIFGSQVFRKSVQDYCGIEVVGGLEIAKTNIFTYSQSECNTALKNAIEAMLTKGTESYSSRVYRRAIERYCGIQVVVDESKDGSASNSYGFKCPPSECNSFLCD